ncbi:hypothetical protein CH379_019905, partial [Leptospira ellisii]
LLDDLIGGLGSVVSGIGRGVKSVWDGVFGGDDPYDNVLLANANGIIAFDGRIVSGSKQESEYNLSDVPELRDANLLQKMGQFLYNGLSGAGWGTDSDLISKAYQNSKNQFEDHNMSLADKNSLAKVAAIKQAIELGYSVSPSMLNDLAESINRFGLHEYYRQIDGDKLKYRFRLDGEGFYNTASQGNAWEHKYGQFELVDTLAKTIAEWKNTHPTDPVPINDLGYKTGGYDPGPNPDHHSGGNQGDLGYMVSGGKYGGDYQNNPNYDVNKTIEFIKTISRNMPVGISGFVKFNDPAVREYFNKPENTLPNLYIDFDRDQNQIKHSNHLHLQLRIDKPAWGY